MTKPRYDTDRHHRRSIRLQGWNYASPGAYFVTICVHRPETILGEVVGEEVVLSPFGNVAADAWLWLASQYPYIDLDEWVIMPDHFHGIIVIHEPDNTPEPVKVKPLGRLVGAFKTVSTKEVNRLRDTPGAPFWQRGYYDRVVRSPQELEAIRKYIQNNPSRWATKCENLAELIARMRYVG
jgi:REP element-mobilizing transposase RayT